ncbi:MAG: hypothetical protein NZM04_06720 [Methylacidiphilales bacterium]|nr:hypothetical protein [Candidatus Methylacidiphilales bacterium]
MRTFRLEHRCGPAGGGSDRRSSEESKRTAELDAVHKSPCCTSHGSTDKPTQEIAPRNLTHHPLQEAMRHALHHKLPYFQTPDFQQPAEYGLSTRSPMSCSKCRCCCHGSYYSTFEARNQDVFNRKASASCIQTTKSLPILMHKL